MLTSETIFDIDTIGRDAIETQIVAFWRERLEGAAEAIAAHVDPDIRFAIVGGQPGRPEPLIFEGIEAVTAAVREIDTNLEFLSFEIVDLLIEGGSVALRWLATLRNRGTGVTGELAVFDLIEVREGRIVSYTEHLDTDCFRRLMAGEAQPMQARRLNAVRPLVSMTWQRSHRDWAHEDRVYKRDSIEHMLRAFWTERLASGSESVRHFWADDGELAMIGDPASVPFARRHVGIDAVAHLIDQIDMEFAFESFRIDRIIVDGDRAAVLWQGDVRHRGTGAGGRIVSFDHVLITDGKIQSITEFFDTAATASWIAG